jgi:hypothetical protein
MRSRRYAETLPVLVFYWFRTVLGQGYSRREWKALGDLIAGFPAQNPEWDSAILALRTRFQQAEVPPAPSEKSSVLESARSHLSNDVLAPYITRLLNEWLPVEVAHLLVDEPGDSSLESEGMPVFTVARGMERLLVRERLSGGTLEALLQPGLLSPALVYPADAEILQDVVLFLLGKTEGPGLPILPALLLCVPPDSPLRADYGQAVAQARMVNLAGTEELHVPISKAQAGELLRDDRLHLGSILATMDGGWWQADRLLEDEKQDLIVYCPGGRLTIQYSGDHARLQIPWPEMRNGWSGPVSLHHIFEIFGRQWGIERWEQDPQQTRLHLVFLGTLPVSKILPLAPTGLRRSRPAAVDMAWASLENALARSFALGILEPMEQLRHPDLIPVGRALYALAESAVSHRLRDREILTKHLRAIEYLQAELVPSYGRVPWRILPETVRKRLLANRSQRDLWAPVFEGFPVVASSGPVRKKDGIGSGAVPA